MFFRHKVLLVLLLHILLVFNDFNKWKHRANANPIDKRPFLQIQSPAITRLILKEFNLTHYLDCTATIDESYYRNETKYYYTWFFNDNILKSLPWKQNDFFVYRNGTLRLPPDEKVSGVYRCKINANDIAVISESITVEYPVLKRRSPYINLTAFTGLSFTFNCPVYSVPPANITWSHGNVSISKNFNDNSFLILTNGSLVLRTVQRENAGKYKCEAHNQFTAKKHRKFSMNLNVVESKDIQTQNGQLIPPLQNTTLYIELNHDLKLMCCTLMDDEPIEWWFQQSSKNPLVKQLNNSREYHIRMINIENDGYYTCSTHVDNQTFHVVLTTPPTVQKELLMYEGIIASPINYKCLVTGNPRPVITWYHNGYRFNSSFTRYINNNELLIPSFDPEENGIYQCFARNIAGEVYTAGEIRLRNRGEEKANPLKNIRCFAHTFSSVNVTFETEDSVPLFVVHIVLRNPLRWVSPYSPMKLNASYIIIDKDLPYIRPFELVTRVLLPTSEMSYDKNLPQQSIQSTLRSLPVTCCTQGLPPRIVHLGNNTFVTWSLTDLTTKKYFIIQFSINFTTPHPSHLLSQHLKGTVQHVNLTQEDIFHKLLNIEPLEERESKIILKNAISNYGDNDASTVNGLEAAEDIFSLVLHANVTGLLLKNFTHLKLRVLLITSDNEYLAQDVRYVEWKTIVNDTSDVISTPYHLAMIESRMLRFHFQDGFNESCVQVCYIQIHYPRIMNADRKCEPRPIVHTELDVKALRPNAHYSFHFSSCDSNIFYGQMNVVTLQDPPGTISNQKVLRVRPSGLKLKWDPPLQANGKIHHYNILWSLGNVTHEANVLDCIACFYRFPNITESAKINISVRVVGDTGVGAPTSIDLRNINYLSLEIENSDSRSQVYSGIAIGSLLSIACIFGFAMLIIFQRKRFKARQQGPTHLSTPTDIHFGSLSNTGLPGGSAGGLSSTTMPTDCHEMQNLIPKAAGRKLDVISGERGKYETTQLPNGNGDIMRKSSEDNENTNTSSIISEYDMGSEHNLSSVPLCKTSPHKKTRLATVSDCTQKPFFVPFKSIHPHNVAIQQKQSSSSFTAGMLQTPPNSIALSLATADNTNGGFGSRRSSSLSSSSNSNGSSTANSIKSKQFHANFPKHSTSIDGICLLAEEQTVSTPTPTSETDDVTAEVLRNGFNTNGESSKKNSSKPLRATNSPPPLSKNSSVKTSKHLNNNNNKTQSKKKTTNLQKSSLSKDKHQPQPQAPPTTQSSKLKTTKNLHNSDLSHIVPANDSLTASTSPSPLSLHTKSLKSWDTQNSNTSSALDNKQK